MFHKSPGDHDNIKKKIVTLQQCYDIGEEHIRVDIGVILYIKVLWWILGLLGVISCRACSRERLPDGHIGNAATLKIFCFLFFLNSWHDIPFTI